MELHCGWYCLYNWSTDFHSQAYQNRAGTLFNLEQIKKATLLNDPIKKYIWNNFLRNIHINLLIHIVFTLLLGCRF